MSRSSLDILAADLFVGDVAVVTGGGSGIGLGIARTLARHGAAIAICGRDADRLEKAASDLRATGARVYAAVADVRDYPAQEQFFAAAEADLGPTKILVCGAAGNFISAAEKLSANGFKTVVDIDLIGTFNSARAAFDQLRRTSGSAVFISAGQAFVPYSHQVHAGAAKAGIEQMMRNLALEWGRYGIRVNSVVPGPIADTEGFQRLIAPADAADLAAAIPLGRLGVAEDVGRAVAFLASPLAAYVTGTRLLCDGGHTLLGAPAARNASRSAEQVS